MWQVKLGDGTEKRTGLKFRPNCPSSSKVTVLPYLCTINSRVHIDNQCKMYNRKLYNFTASLSKQNSPDWATCTKNHTTPQQTTK